MLLFLATNGNNNYDENYIFQVQERDAIVASLCWLAG